MAPCPEHEGLFCEAGMWHAGPHETSIPDPGGRPFWPATYRWPRVAEKARA